ncbi:NmrA family NAD(P)-binding protein [Marinicrinis lubricantis]|uniref:NmrA family NAD(P)-binding protein n=1 Tax=Marinicrinis lubricantis TaxID=2086470 RepID=A0ABW1IK16_9BACL
MTILVTGASGKVGRHLVQLLLEAGEHVRVLTRNTDSGRFPESVDVVAGDLTEPSTLESAFQGIRAAHLITSANGHIPLQNGKDIAAVAEKAGVQRVTVMWNGEIGSVDKAVMASGMEWTLLQPVEFMSNALEWAESIRFEDAVRDLQGKGLSAAVHEKDIAAVAAVALTEDGHAGKSYVLTGPEALSVQNKVDAISKALGRNIRLIEHSREQEKERMRQMGVQEEVIDYVIDWHLHPPKISYTVSPAVQEVTGRSARTFVQWVAEHMKDFR